MPSSGSRDRGIFVSVAARLLAGDRLYAGVWDNKDPYFYYLTTPGRLLGPSMDLLVELGWLALASWSVYSLVLRDSNRRTALLLGGAITPLILTGLVYIPGYTNLPGTAVSLAVIAAVRSGRVALGGVLAGILLYLELIVFPLTLVLAAFALALEAHRRSFMRFVFGGVGAAGVGTLVLVVRGELVPYLSTLKANVAYANGPLVHSRWGSVVGHLARTLGGLTGAPMALLLGTVLAIVGAGLLAYRRGGGVKPREMPLVWLAAIALVGSVAVLGVTGLWPHHAQLLYLPAALVVACFGPLVAVGPTAPAPRWVTLGGILLAGLSAALGVTRLADYQHQPYMAYLPLALSVIIVTLMTSSSPRPRITAVSAVPLVAIGGLVLLLGGLTALRSFAGEWRIAAQVWRLDRETPPEAERLLALGTSGSYARLGQNDDQGHASGVPHWHLVCPRFHQYPFQPAAILDQVLTCARTSPVLLISKSLAPSPGSPGWNRYVGQVEQMLATSYRCSEAQDIRVCTRLDSAR